MFIQVDYNSLLMILVLALSITLKNKVINKGDIENTQHY